VSQEVTEQDVQEMELRRRFNLRKRAERFVQARGGGFILRPPVLTFAEAEALLQTCIDCGIDLNKPRTRIA